MKPARVYDLLKDNEKIKVKQTTEVRNCFLVDMTLFELHELYDVICGNPYTKSITERACHSLYILAEREQRLLATLFK